MRLHKLTISGFKSFAERQVLEFPDRAGLCYLTGVNEVEPELGANAVGKSTVGDALCWVFYECTARGTKGAAVETRGAQAGECYVRAHFTAADGAKCTITRMRNPRRCTVKHRGELYEADQQQVEALVGADFTTFLSTVLMSQFGSYFVDVTPAQRLKLLTRGLRLQLWEQLSQDARDAAQRVNETVRELQLQEARLEERAAVHQQQADQASKRISTLRKERKRAAHLERNKLEVELHQWTTIRSRSEQEVQRHRRLIDDLQREASEAIQTLAAMQREQDKCTHHVDTAAAQADKAQLSLRRAQTQVDKGQCPLCKQALDVHTKQGMLLPYSREIEERKAQERTAWARLEECNAQLPELELWVSELDARRAYHTQLCDEAKRKVSVAASEARRVQQELRLVQGSQTGGGIARDLDELIRTRKQALDSADEVQGEAHAKHAETQRAARREQRLRFWPEGFKEVRLYEIGNAVDVLRMQAEGYAERLGLTGWRIVIAVSKATARGTTVPGLHVAAVPPGHEEEIPWEALSGGETQRVRLAVAMAISSMLRERTGFECNLEIWDEPTAHLSQVGVEALMECLHERARARQVWVIDHRTMDAAFFDGCIWKVCKRAGGSVVDVVQ
jgi:DNA repair exonuclease SbcCD ATPase subunit